MSLFAAPLSSSCLVLRTRFLLLIDLLDRISFRHDSYFGIDLNPYYIPLSFLSFVLFFVIVCLTFVLVACLYFGSPNFVP